MQDIFIKNLLRAKDALNFLGANKVSCNYSGGGDEGDINEVKVTYENNSEIPGLIENHLVTIFEESSYTNQISRVTISYEDAIRILCQKAIDHFGHAGYGNDDGGCGSFCINSNGLITLDHTDYGTVQGCAHLFSMALNSENDESYFSQTQKSRLETLGEKLGDLGYESISIYGEFTNNNLSTFTLNDQLSNKHLCGETLTEIQNILRPLANQLFSDFESKFDPEYKENCEDFGNVSLYATFKVKDGLFSGHLEEPTEGEEDNTEYNHEIDLESYFAKKTDTNEPSNEAHVSRKIQRI